MRHATTPHAILLLGYLLLYLMPLGFRPLSMPDETRYAEIPREMLSSHDFVVPRLVGLRYFEKPVMGYWVSALSIHSFGENAFAVRLPLAVATGVSALLLLLFVARFAGGRMPGVLAAAAFLTSMGVFAIGIFNCLDALLSLFVTGTLICFFFAYATEDRRRRAGFLGLTGLFCGAAFLTKGFLAFALPVAIIVPFLAWERRWRALFTMAWLPLVVAVAVALPWCIAIHRHEPDFWHYFFWIEHLQRFSSEQAQHLEPWWFYLPVVVGGVLPWTALIPAATIGLARDRFRDPLVRFAVCWFFFPFMLFSLSDGKLGTYMLPLFPPLVILTVIGLQKYFEGPRRRTFVAGVVALSGVLIVGALVGAIVPISRWPAGWICMVPAVAIKIAVCAAMAVWALLAGFSGLGKKQSVAARVALFASGAAVFFCTAHLVLSGITDEGQTPGGFLTEHAGDVPEDALLVSDSYLSPALGWFYRRQDIAILEAGGELSYGLAASDAAGRFLTVEALCTQIARHAGEDRIVLVLKSGTYARLRALLPDPVYEDVDQGFAFVRY